MALRALPPAARVGYIRLSQRFCYSKGIAQGGCEFNGRLKLNNILECSHVEITQRRREAVDFSQPAAAGTCGSSRGPNPHHGDAKNG